MKNHNHFKGTLKMNEAFIFICVALLAMFLTGCGASDLKRVISCKEEIHNISGQQVTTSARQLMTTTDAVSYSNTLQDKPAYCRPVMPVLLTDLEPVRNTNIVVNRYGGSTLNVDTSTFNQNVTGEKYESTLMFDAGWTHGTEGKVTYYTNYQYMGLTGLVYRPYYSLGGNGESEQWYEPGYVKIYGDNVLLYESPKITQSTYETYVFTLDISSVREVTLEMGGSWAPGMGSVATCGVANAEMIRK